METTTETTETTHAVVVAAATLVVTRAQENLNAAIDAQQAVEKYFSTH